MNVPEVELYFELDEPDDADAIAKRVATHLGVSTAASPVAPRNEEPVLIIGAGPAGLFCAYELARNGIASIILERGKKVQSAAG